MWLILLKISVINFVVVGISVCVVSTLNVYSVGQSFTTGGFQGRNERDTPLPFGKIYTLNGSKWKDIW